MLISSRARAPDKLSPKPVIYMGAIALTVSESKSQRHAAFLAKAMMVTQIIKKLNH